MTISIKHPFTSLKGDGGDATLVRPSNWNADHTTSMATGKLIGRLTAGAGAFEEIGLSAFVAAALDETSGPAFLNALGLGGFETGDVKFSINPTPSTGWIAYQGQGTIGKAGSGATVLADASAQALYELVYNNITNTYAPVSGGRTGNATNDFNAGKTITMPWLSGRAVIGAGGGGSLTTRTCGEFSGAETHTLSVAELAVHYHSASIYDPTHIHGVNQIPYWTTNSGGSGVGGGGVFGVAGTTSISIQAAATGVRVNSSNGLDTTYSTGSGSAHNNMQPFVALWTKVKL